MKKVMVFGTFDIIHPGHLFFLTNAKDFGDYLIVVIGRDEIVKKVKGRDPEKDENQRMKNIKETGLADEVVLGDKKDMYKIIEEQKPTTICLGYDQNSFTDDLLPEMAKRKINVKIVKLPPFKEDEYKSSLLRR